MSLREAEKDLELGFCAEIPVAFSCLEEARNSLEYHWNCIHHLFEDIREQCPDRLNDWAESRRQSFAKTLQSWKEAFEAFFRIQKAGWTPRVFKLPMCSGSVTSPVS